MTTTAAQDEPVGLDDAIALKIRQTLCRISEARIACRYSALMAREEIERILHNLDSERGVDSTPLAQLSGEVVRSNAQLETYVDAVATLARIAEKVHRH